MNKNLKTFIAALRSGNYRKANGRLRRESVEDKKWCCSQGVACDVSQMGEWRFRNDSWVYVVDGRQNMFFMPGQVIEWLGLTQKQADQLIGMNDNGNTFDEIADWLETL